MDLHDGESYDWLNNIYHKKASSLYFGKGEYWHDGPDASTIDDHCCRLYTRPDFEMKWILNGDQFFHDFCMDESDIASGSSTVFHFNEIQWITSMQSWRCGAQVHSKFTNVPDSMVESTASGGASNSLVDLNESTVLELSAYSDSEWRPAGDNTNNLYPATVFSGTNCTGDSSEIILNTNDGVSTRSKYSKVEESLTVG